jgi:aromatic-L-amino-acid decarboxylase
VDADPDFERLAPAPFSTVCFRARPRGRSEETLDELNAALLAAVNATGRIFLSHTRLRGRYTLRLAIGNIRTGEAHVREAWALVRRELGRLLDSA